MKKQRIYIWNYITDKNQAYILPAKLMAATVIDLLAEDARQGKEIMQDHPRKDKASYFALWDDLLK